MFNGARFHYFLVFPGFHFPEHKSHLMDKHLGYLPRWIIAAILKVDQIRTPTNGPENWELLTMDKALHPRNDVDRQYVSRKEGRRFASIQDNVDTSMQRLEDYIKKHRGRLITATRNNTTNTSINRTKITRW